MLKKRLLKRLKEHLVKLLEIMRGINVNDNNQEKKDKLDDDENLSQEEIMVRKLEMLCKLCELSNAGAKLSQNYSLNSDLKMMKFEYELHKNLRAKQNK